MPEIIKYENTFKTRVKVFLKSKKTKKLFLVTLILIIIIGALLTILGTRDNKPTYKTIEDVYYSQFSSKQVYEVKELKRQRITTIKVSTKKLLNYLLL